ncbi:MAG: hypothetical protein AAFQ89_05935 [Cyanobacteria bacterium J06626_18]
MNIPPSIGIKERTPIPADYRFREFISYSLRESDVLQTGHANANGKASVTCRSTQTMNPAISLSETPLKLTK